MKIDKITIDKIREALPYGAQKKIATQTKYSPEYVNAVLRNAVPVNFDIISAAQKIIREKNELQKRVIDKIKKDLL